MVYPDTSIKYKLNKHKTIINYSPLPKYCVIAVISRFFMSQRTKNIDKEITIDLSFKVILKSFSNHDGFSEKQIENAIEEFK